MSLIQMTHADYLANAAYGASDIIKMRNSFAYFDHRRKNPEPAGRPLVVGSATHLMLQSEMTNDPALVKNGILTYKDGSSRTEGFREFQAKNPMQYCVDEEEYLLCRRMIAALLSEPEVMGYLTGAIPEATIITNYPHTGIQVKCRPDYLHRGRGVSINVKTAADASESGFLYSARDYGYDWQSVFYCDILKQEFEQSFDEIHIVVEKGDSLAECPVHIYSFGEDTLNFARSQIWEILQRLSECQKTGIWPKNRAYLQQIDLPSHMRKVVSL